MKKILFLIPVLFFLIGIYTLPHYGINWDTINHLPRGQAYLNYFLSGKKDYSNLTQKAPEDSQGRYWQDPETFTIKTDRDDGSIPTRSLYESDAASFGHYTFDKSNSGHPPVSDVLSAVFNRIFFSKLHWVNDIDAYRIYGVLVATALVALILHWTMSVYGPLPGLVASLSLSLYPLFWSESHFNTEKDIPETVFYSFFLYSIWRAFTKKNWKWILVSGIFFGLGLGTKLNILFSIYIILPWLIFLVVKNGFKPYLKLIVPGIIALFLAFVIVFATWPYLWSDPIGTVMNVIGYYKMMGTYYGAVDPRFVTILGIRTFPLLWIIYTTPLFTLFLAGTGILVAISRVVKKKDETSLLFLLWLLVPILRVIWPGSSIYGGIRQLMEYIPATALISGLAVKFFWDMSRSKTWRLVVLVSVVIGFGWNVYSLYKIHPNENIFFNKLIGGLPGAKAKDFPYWGFSFGSPYRQAITWLNKNAEPGAKAVFTYDLLPNIPKIWIRRDIELHNAARSGYLRKGEYAIGLVYQGTATRTYYDMYLENFIEPVYEIKVDGVAILKIWRNNQDHLKYDWREQLNTRTSYKKMENRLRFDLGKVAKLSRLEIIYSQANCSPLQVGNVFTSVDGVKWSKMPGDLPNDWRVAVSGEQPKGGKFIEPFIGQEARYIELFLRPEDTCLFQIQSQRVFTFAEDK